MRLREQAVITGTGKKRGPPIETRLTRATRLLFSAIPPPSDRLLRSSTCKIVNYAIQEGFILLLKRQVEIPGDLVAQILNDQNRHQNI